MSYLLSAVDADCIEPLLARACSALPAGGMLVAHDFMVEDDKCGPADAALWFLTCLFNAPGAMLLTPAESNGAFAGSASSVSPSASSFPG
jgi:hypothetical protein